MSGIPELTGFTRVADIPAESWSRFPVDVPADLRELNAKYGQGMYARDFIRFVDPSWAYDQVVDSLPEATLIPFAFTGMGDVIVWDPQSREYFSLRYREARVSGLGPDFALILEMLETNAPKYLESKFGWSPFPEAVQRYGMPEMTQCFSYVPSLLLGGRGDLDSLQIVNLPVCVSILDQCEDLTVYFNEIRNV